MSGKSKEPRSAKRKSNTYIPIHICKYRVNLIQVGFQYGDSKHIKNISNVTTNTCIHT